MREHPKRVLDLFCGAGGAAMGLHQAWPDAEIVGVDIKPQPRYPFSFIEADVMTFLGWAQLSMFDFIWASPPCQKFTTLKTMWNHKNGYPDLIEPTRAYLSKSGAAYVIENVPGAPLLNPFALCGSSFGLGVEVYDGWRQLRRHRLFETSFAAEAPGCKHTGATIGIYGDHARDRRRKPGVRERGIDFPDVEKLPLGRKAMGIDWMHWKELSQAIPPAYSRYIAEQYCKGGE